MKKFFIAGSIVDTDQDRETFEDVTPAQVNSALNSLEPDEEFVLDITSYGGSVTAGLAICNLLKQASANGHKTTAHVIGIAASMASAIACACDELQIDSNAFIMVHNPWTMALGNAGELRKEAETLDQYRDALLAVYRTKFGCSDEVLKKMLDDETWIIGESAPFFQLSAEVIPMEEPLRAAAFAKSMPRFMHTPKALKEIIMERESAVKAQEDLTTCASNEMTNDNEMKTAQETVQEAVEAEEAKTTAETTEMVAKAEVDKRVSGMQSAMAKQMDAMKKDYEAKIADFQVQIEAKDEELTKVKAEVTSLTESLEKSAKELAVMTSAFEEKANALNALNNSVNTPNAESTTDWRKLKGKEFFDWYKKTH